MVPGQDDLCSLVLEISIAGLGSLEFSRVMSRRNLTENELTYAALIRSRLQ